MNFQRGKQHEDLEMNLVPLIDVLLVIIIFLVVNATFSRMSELQINLPTAQANPVEQKPAIINVGIDASGHYVIEKVAVNGSDVGLIVSALQNAVAGAKDPTIVINADAKTAHQSVINVMEAARQAGYTHITFATQQNSGS
jgi:biopolymer transport protein ExbD